MTVEQLERERQDLLRRIRRYKFMLKGAKERLAEVEQLKAEISKTT